MKVHVYDLYGQGGEAVDTLLSGDGLGYIESRLKAIPNVIVHDAKLVRAPPPKQLKAMAKSKLKTAFSWDSGNDIAAQIRAVPKEDKIIMIGVSLGACEIPYIASHVTRDIDTLIGIQPSYFGRHNLVPSNVKRAVCIYNPVWFITGGFGYYRWQGMLGNNRTHLLYVKSYWPHPGDNNAAVHKRVIDEVRVLVSP